MTAKKRLSRKSLFKKYTDKIVLDTRYALAIFIFFLAVALIALSIVVFKYLTEEKESTRAIVFKSGGVTVTTVDAGTNIGKFPSIAIGTDGKPVISYHDEQNHYIKVVRCGNYDCSEGNTINDVAYIEWITPAHPASLTIGADGNPVISYYYLFFDFPQAIPRLMLAKCGDTSCSSGNAIITIEKYGNGRFSSMEIGSDGYPVISYYHGGLMVAKCGDSSCSAGNSTIRIDAGADIGQYTSLELDSNSIPIISYYHQPNGDLKIVKCGDASCSSGNEMTTLDSAGDVGLYTSLKIGIDGNPVISYYDNTSGDLKVLKCGNPACSNGNEITVVDSAGDVGLHTSIALGPKGNPVISYYDSTNGDLKLANCGNPSCSSGNEIITVDSEGDVGLHTSITMGEDNNPVIAYYDSTYQDLKVAHLFLLPLYQIKDLNSELDALDSTGDNIEVGSENGVTGLQGVRIKDSDNNYPVVDFSNVNFIEDLSWNNLSADSDSSLNKAVVDLSGSLEGFSGSFSLYVPRDLGDDILRICPNALSLSDVTMTCSGGFDLQDGESASGIYVSKTSVDSLDVWELSGVTGTGAMSYSDLCGDGSIGITEECDDGNTDNGDGCSSSCEVEQGWNCIGDPSNCTEICGDSLIVGDEVCDLNSQNCIVGGYLGSQTCNGQCDGWTTCLISDYCGDGVMNGEETCDDGDTDNGDGCSSSCEVEQGWDCSGDPSVCTEICGDSLIVGDEVCDSNSQSCSIGANPGSQSCNDLCSGWNACQVGEYCGDGIVNGTEECDDGGLFEGDGCSSLCQVEQGWDCSGDPSDCHEICGDGLIVGQEVCDLGRQTCTIGGYSGTKVCNDTCDRWGECQADESCGDGRLNGPEECDDGGIVSGDGCSSHCLIENFIHEDDDNDGIDNYYEVISSYVNGRQTSFSNSDSDGDGYTDGEEDINKDGELDEGESDPTDAYSFPLPESGKKLEEVSGKLSPFSDIIVIGGIALLLIALFFLLFLLFGRKRDKDEEEEKPKEGIRKSVLAGEF